MHRVSDRLYTWASLLDEQTLAQAEKTASLPFIHPHVALMPDAHLGKGATVGSVLPTAGAIIPAAVGVDIGCGMTAVRTRFVADELPRDRRPLREAIERVIPLSAGRYNRSIATTSAARRIDELELLAAEADLEPAADAVNWRLQLGSLGSGNHFIEVSLDEEDRVWLFLTPAPAASATASPSGTSASLRSSPADRAPPFRTVTSPTSPRARRSSTPMCASCAGPSGSPSSTARR
jgi:tRNA-splicing ligase RtcB